MIVLDAPTLFESGADRFCDYIVSIVAPEELRFQRIIARDHLTIEEARSRIQAQHDQEYYTSRSWHVIHNDKSEEELRLQVQNLHSRLQVLLAEEEPTLEVQ